MGLYRLCYEIINEIRLFVHFLRYSVEVRAFVPKCRFSDPGAVSRIGSSTDNFNKYSATRANDMPTS